MVVLAKVSVVGRLFCAGHCTRVTGCLHNDVNGLSQIDDCWCTCWVTFCVVPYNSSIHSVISKIIPALEIRPCKLISLGNVPAAMVSPPRRMRIRPISLLDEKVSRGSGRDLALGSDIPDTRRVISTSADMPFVRTLGRSYEHQSYGDIVMSNRGFSLITLPLDLSMVVTSLDRAAGTSRDWWKSSTCSRSGQ